MLKRAAMILTIATAAIANAASYHIDFFQPTVVNGTTLKPGEAKLEVKDNKAIVKQGKTTVEANVKVETAKEKFLYTTVGYKDGSNHEIKDITLAGTTTRLVFE